MKGLILSSLIVIALLGAASASPTHKFPIVDEDIGAATDAWMDWASAELPRVISEMQDLIGEDEPRRDLVVRGRTGSSCCKCVQKHAKKIIDKISYHMEQRCQNATGCAKQHCRMMKREPDVSRGILLAHVHPHGLAYAYCRGKGKCQSQHHSSVSESEMPRDYVQLSCGANLVDDDLTDPMLMEQTHVAIQSIEAQDGGFINSTLFADELDEITELLYRELSENGESSDIAIDPPADAIRHRDQRMCRHCVHFNNAHQVIHHLDAFKKLCKNTECPFLKHICKWAKAHHKEFLGILLAHTTPHRFSAGYCSGRKLCNPHDLPCEARL